MIRSMNTIEMEKEELLHKSARWAEDEEYLECVRDILDSKVFQSMDQFIQHGHTTCKEHCIQVSYIAYEMCRNRGWDSRSAARAGLLHDLFLYDWHTHAKETGQYFHGFTHPRVAMNNAVRYFEATEKEQNMILRHMWPLTPILPKYKEGYIILYADKLCGLAEFFGHMKTWILVALWPRQMG